MIAATTTERSGTMGTNEWFRLEQVNVLARQVLSQLSLHTHFQLIDFNVLLMRTSQNRAAAF